ncbi:MAG TPA: hypothetical protein VGK74_10090 [Symbiobacteriaceae bacterium]
MAQYTDSSGTTYTYKQDGTLTITQKQPAAPPKPPMTAAEVKSFVGDALTVASGAAQDSKLLSNASNVATATSVVKEGVADYKQNGDVKRAAAKTAVKAVPQVLATMNNGAIATASIALAPETGGLSLVVGAIGIVGVTMWANKISNDGAKLVDKAYQK